MQEISACKAHDWLTNATASTSISQSGFARRLANTNVLTYGASVFT